MALPLLGAFLATSIGALVKKALVAIGIGTITYAGLDTAFQSVQTHVIENYGQLSGASLQLADLAGVGSSLGIVLGALGARIGLAALSRLGRVL